MERSTFGRWSGPSPGGEAATSSPPPTPVRTVGAVRSHRKAGRAGRGRRGPVRRRRTGAVSRSVPGGGRRRRAGAPAPKPVPITRSDHACRSLVAITGRTEECLDSRRPSAVSVRGMPGAPRLATVPLTVGWRYSSRRRGATADPARASPRRSGRRTGSCRPARRSRRPVRPGTPSTSLQISVSRSGEVVARRRRLGSASVAVACGWPACGEPCRVELPVGGQWEARRAR